MLEELNLDDKSDVKQWLLEKEEIQHCLNTWFLEKQVYKEAIKNLIESNKLKDICISELEDYLSEKEYDDYIANYVREAEKAGIKTIKLTREATSWQIAVEAKILLGLLDEKLYSDEIGDILNFNTSEVEMALRQYSRKGTEEDGKTE